MNRLFFWLLLMVVSFGCSASEPAVENGQDAATPAQSATELPDRDPELARRLVDQEQALLLDVRTPEEFSEGYAQGATNIPVQVLEDRLGEVEQLLEGDKDRPIVVYCRSGGRAGRAKSMLQEAGFSRITNLGGLSDWTGPTEKPQP